ncbi:MAG: amidase family protein, partial [Aquirufa sp.]
MSYTSQPFAKIREKLLAGELSVSAIVAGHLDQIQAHNESLNAFLEVYDQEAIAQAVVIDAKIKAGTAGRLAGLVVGIKDLLCYEGHHSYAGSKILDSFKSTFSATAVQRLLDEDAIIIGRQNCDEFGMGSTNENSA